MQFSPEEIAARRAEYAAATEAWNATWEAKHIAEVAHLNGGAWEPVAQARAAHEPNVARFEAAFQAMAELPDDEELDAQARALEAAAAQGRLL